MRFIVLASLMLTSTAAWAAPASTSRPATAETDADASAFKGMRGNSKEFHFEEDSVSGDALKPDHSDVQARAQTRWKSMIEVRLHFIPQMLQMANDV